MSRFWCTAIIALSGTGARLSTPLSAAMLLGLTAALGAAVLLAFAAG
jgi:hypothetical protein